MATRAEGLPKTSSCCSVQECRSWSELEALRPEWERLLRQNRSLGLFSTPEWLGPWWHAYGAGKELRSLVVTGTDGVIAILPMYAERVRQTLFLSTCKLRLVGDGSKDSDDQDIIVQPGYEAVVVEAFLEWAKGESWDICEWNCISPRSRVTKLLREQLTKLRWTHSFSQRPLVVVPLPRTWEEYLKQLSSKERGKVGHRYRHLQNRYKVNFRRCERMEELPNDLETLFRLHQKRWLAKGQPGSFSVAQRRLFYYNMAAALLAKGQLELWVLELNGEAIAAQIGLRYGDKLHSLQEGFDPAYASDSVGYVLRSHVLRYCIESGIRYYDFLAGDQDSKQRWGALTGTYTDLQFARSGSKGDLFLRRAKAAGAIKRWMKRHLPPSLVNKLLSLRRSPENNNQD